MSGNDPEETMPFTHRPYGSEEAVNPATAPEGAATQDSGQAFVSPSPPRPQMASPPYGPPVIGQPAPATWGASAGYPGYAGSQQHKGASTARTLGIVSVASAGIAFFCCFTLPGIFAGPFAWVIGVKAQREIDANPGVYGNRGHAEAGVVMGIIGTILSVLTFAGIIVVVVALGSMNWTLV